MGLINAETLQPLPRRQAVIESRQQFTSTKAEHASEERQRQQILGDERRSIDGSNTIYTVPPDKRFFLTSAAISLSHENGVDTVAAFLRIVKTGDATVAANLIDIFKLEIEGHFNIATNSLSFTMPIRLVAGDEIILRYDEDALAAGETQVFFCGWEEDDESS